MVNLKDATLKQLVTERPDLVRAIKDGKDDGTTISSIIKDLHGRIVTWTEERRDIDSVLISKRVDGYTYYETGEVDIIIQEIYDGEGLVGKKNVKHYKDNKQPTVEILVGKYGFVQGK